MIKIFATLLSTTTIATLSLTVLVLTANAQAQLELSGVSDATYDIEVRASEDCDDADDRCQPDARGNITVTKELDKATPAANTNVCDGVTCADGSCAATSDSCTASAAAPDYLDPDDDGDGLEQDRRLPIREGGQTIDAGTAPESARAHTSTDIDSDGRSDDTQRAQDYNSSRSNKYSRAAFSGSDIDKRPEVSLRTAGYLKIGGVDGDSGSHTAEDGEVVCWGRAEDEDGKVYAWGQGICVALEVTKANASDTAQTRLAALQTRGEDVRGWSEEERAAWQEYRATRATSTREERLVEKMVKATQSNERIQSIEADDSEVVVRHKAKIRLFGIFPIERELTSRATASGEVTTNYPWYRFLSRVPDKSAINNTLKELQALLAEGGIDKTSPYIIQ